MHTLKTLVITYAYKSFILSVTTDIYIYIYIYVTGPLA